MVSCICILIAATTLASYRVFVNGSASTESPIDLKAVPLVNTAKFYAHPYSAQIAENVMRNWGIPFDVVNIGSVTASSFWDSANLVNKYQFVVFFGAPALQDEGTQSSTVIDAFGTAFSFSFRGPY